MVAMAVTKTFEIINERGLHARASAKFVELVEGFESDVLVTSDGVSVNGDSIMGLLTLAVSRGMTIEVQIEGPDEEDLAAAIKTLIAGKFDERT